MINKRKIGITPLSLAIQAVGGCQKTLAEKVGVSPQAISLLKKRGGQLPVGKMKIYSDATGLPKEVLYPAIFAA